MTRPSPPSDPWHRTRDVLLFFAGLAGIAYETVLAPSPEPSLLVIFAAMLGLPIVLRKEDGK